MQCKARPHVGRPNAMQGEFPRWAPKRKTHPQRKRPHKGALGKKTSWRMDKNKFWLGGRRFNTASPRLGAPTQRKARPQVGRPNATQGMSRSWVPERTSAMQKQGTSARPQVGHPNVTQGEFARWAPKRKTHPQQKRQHKEALGKFRSPTYVCNANAMHVRNARHVRTSANWVPQRNARHIHKVGRANATQGMSARWVPKRNTRHVRKLGTPTQRKAHPQVGRPNAHPQCKRKARPHVRKLGTPTQRKARPQDGHPNAKLIRNENVHTREH
jgi:hypothetical protein